MFSGDSLNFLLTLCPACAVIGFINLVPANFNIPNDGMSVLAAMQSKQAKHGLYIMLSVNHATLRGKDYIKIPENIG